MHPKKRQRTIRKCLWARTIDFTPGKPIVSVPSCRERNCQELICWLHLREQAKRNDSGKEQTVCCLMLHSWHPSLAACGKCATVSSYRYRSLDWRPRFLSNLTNLHR